MAGHFRDIVGTLCSQYFDALCAERTVFPVTSPGQCGPEASGKATRRDTIFQHGYSTADSTRSEKCTCPDRLLRPCKRNSNSSKNCVALLVLDVVEISEALGHTPTAVDPRLRRIVSQANLHFIRSVGVAVEWPMILLSLICYITRGLLVLELLAPTFVRSARPCRLTVYDRDGCLAHAHTVGRLRGSSGPIV